MHTAREILKAVRRIEIATKRAVNAELAGRYHSVFKGQGMSFSEVRPYTPGDDIRHIDWNVSARAQGIFVKQFVEERELTVTLVVDLSASGGFGTRGKKKRSVLAEVGALIAFSAIKNNDRVGLLLFTEGVELYLPPRKGTRHVLRVIREIFEVQPKAAGTSINEALAYLSRVQKRRSVCFVLSDFIDPRRPGDAEHRLRYEPALKVAMARHDVVAVRVADPAEQQLPDLGLVELVDAETGKVELIDSSSPRVRASYQQRRKRERDETKKRFHQLGLDLVDLSTDGDFVTPLVEFFRARSTRLRAGR